MAGIVVTLFVLCLVLMAGVTVYAVQRPSRAEADRLRALQVQRELWQAEQRLHHLAQESIARMLDAARQGSRVEQQRHGLQ